MVRCLAFVWRRVDYVCLDLRRLRRDEGPSLTWEVIVHVVTECLIRFTSFGLYFPADTVLQGTIMRIVLGIVGSWALAHGEPNGYDEMV